MRKRGFSFRSPRSRTSDAACMEYADFAGGGFPHEAEHQISLAANDFDERSEALSMEHATSEVLNTNLICHPFTKNAVQ